MMTINTTARIENLKPVPVRVKSGITGAAQFAVRKLFDLQLHTIWQALGRLLPQVRGSLLDVGCGEMPFRFALQPDVAYTGIDVEEAISFGMSGDNAIHAFDGRTIPFPDDHFDNILCTEVLEHADAPEQLLVEMHRVLKPGGMLIMTVPFAARVHHAPYDFQRFTRHKLEQMFSPFTKATIAPRGNDIATIANKLIVLIMRLLKPSINMIWSVPMALLIAPVAGIFLAAAHLSIATALGSSDDPLGYSVIAHK
jgi:ubiquinone/menaquinone biosynthesis C-methylase UbiE